MNKLFDVLPLLVGLFFVALIFLIKRVKARGMPVPPASAQPPRQPLIKASAASLKAFRQSFARRRWLHRLLSYPAIGSGLLVLYLGAEGKRDNALFEFLGLYWREFGFCASVFGMLALLIGKVLLLRCPACGEGLATGSRLGTDFIINRCPHCHLQLS
ncbi:hypothetical protein [Hyalangium minutum]|uniref:Uncharacterized protein n=1 Tax=Hyalangium minutum TaxID=394096 RepID=A0A085VZN9_9BACT|nr:hypothetical protein [Hyalangium minutum]KFE60902.1 hypothetical protein DB31_4815 [Hyalangium minutum]